MQISCKHPSILSDFNENLSTSYLVVPAGRHWGDSISG